MDERNSSYPASPPPGGSNPYQVVSRRELRSAPATRRVPWRKGAAVAVALGLAAGAYGFASASDGDHQFASLSADPQPVPEPARTGSVSRSVDRLPLDDAVTRTIVVDVDGEEHQIDTRARTLAQALADAGIEVGFLDEVSAPMNGEPVDATVVRVTESIEVVDEKIPYATTRTETNNLTKGTERVQTAGKDGQRVTTKRVLTRGGEVISEEVLAEAVGSEPVDEVILVGTRPKPAPTVAAPSTSSSGSSAPAQTYSGGSPKAIAQDMLGSFGWGQDQWSCLNNLWIRESNWNPRAANPYSGAYGIPQSLPGSKMASVGADWQTNPATQIRWGLGYIKGRYGSPCGAWSHSQATGWY